MDFILLLALVSVWLLSKETGHLQVPLGELEYPEKAHVFLLLSFNGEVYILYRQILCKSIYFKLLIVLFLLIRTCSSRKPQIQNVKKLEHCLKPTGQKKDL